MISIKALNKFFNKGKQNEIHVINDITLDLPERGMIAIFGKSGCGKTTLLNVIGGLDGFASGSLTIEGQSIEKNTDEIRNKYVGYIFQNYNLSNNESCYDFCDRLLYEKHIFLTPGGIFGDEGEKYVRISLCASEDMLQRVLDRIKG